MPPPLVSPAMMAATEGTRWPITEQPVPRAPAGRTGRPNGPGLLIMLAYRAAMDGASHKEVVDLADHVLESQLPHSSISPDNEPERTLVGPAGVNIEHAPRIQRAFSSDADAIYR